MIKRFIYIIKGERYKYNINKKGKCEISMKAHISTNCFFEGHNKITAHTSLNNCKIGYASYINSNSFFNSTDIGKYCSISSSVRLVTGNHPTKDYVSSHPLFYSDKKISGLTYNVNSDFQEYSYADDEKTRLCIIGNDVWIGSNVLIMNGIKIGDGAIIAAGAVVTKNVPEYAIWGGVPAKHIRYRFAEEEISFLLELKWWNKSEVWIRNHAILFNKIEKLKNEIYKEISINNTNHEKE